jgi:hypothetical protein
VTEKGRGVLWYPTQAKVRLEWGTQLRWQVQSAIGPFVDCRAGSWERDDQLCFTGN